MPKRDPVRVEDFGKLADGRLVKRVTLTNTKGESVSVISYGAIVTSIVVLDLRGQLDEVTLGYSDLAGYVGDTYFLGAVVGRYANRIAQGRFELDGQTYQLPQNQLTNHLHGGPQGFYQALYNIEVPETSEPCVELSLVSQDGESGYPGELQVTVRYTWGDDSRLVVDYSARTTKPTVVNLTQHSYFNLAGQGSVLEHQLQVFAERYTPTDELAIPTGDYRDVSGTPFDFREPHRLGERIEAEDSQLKLAGGYDHNFVIEGQAGLLRPAALLQEPSKGRTLRVVTTEPGMHLYSGNFLPRDASVSRGEVNYGYRDGVCLETQHFPNSPNVPHFPSTRLDPGRVWTSRTVFEFGVG